MKSLLNSVFVCFLIFTSCYSQTKIDSIKAIDTLYVDNEVMSNFNVEPIYNIKFYNDSTNAEISFNDTLRYSGTMPIDSSAKILFEFVFNKYFRELYKLRDENKKLSLENLKLKQELERR